MIRLSKSKLMSAPQCPKRLHLEVRHPELKKFSPNTETVFATGHRVGALGREVQDGSAYLEAIGPASAHARREHLRARLLDHCRFDTEAMVRLMHFFASAGRPAPLALETQ